MNSLLWSLALLLVLVTVLPLFRSQKWWIRIWDFPRLQISVLLAVVLAVFLLLQRPLSAVERLTVLTLAASLAYQIREILPYTPLSKTEVLQSNKADPLSSIRLLIVNVLMDNRRAADFLGLVRANEPDLVLAVETDDWWDRELAVLDRDYPFAIKHPLPNTYGMHLFSKLELGSPKLRFLVEDDVPSIYAAVRLRSGVWIDLHCVHPRPPKPRRDTDKRDAEIVIVGRAVAQNGKPAIVAGDFNDVAWSHTTRQFKRLSDTRDPRVGRAMLNTFHAGYLFLRWPLDHVFVDEDYMLGRLQRLSYFGSDHFPVLAEIHYAPKNSRLPHL